MAGTNILREYLLSLGFKINVNEAKKFDRQLADSGKAANFLGLKVTAAAATIAALAEVYANSMEKLYYSSKRSGSTVKQIQGLVFAGEQFGISGATMQGAIEGMAKALRGNPGLAGLLKSLGVKTEGRTSAQELVDLVDSLRKMPFYVAKNFASMFGLDEDTLNTWFQNFDKMKALAAEREEMDKTVGVDADRNAEAMHEWQRAIGRVMTEFTVLEGVVANLLLPTMHDLEEWSRFAIKGVNKALQEGGGFWATTKGVLNALEGPEAGAKNPDGTPKAGWGAASRSGMDPWDEAVLDWLIAHGGKGLTRFKPTGAGSSTAGAGRGSVNPGQGSISSSAYSKQQIDDAISNFSDAYGVPESLLRAIAQVESGSGKNRTSPTGVRGLMQITEKNARRLGGDRNDDLDSLRMAAQMLQENFKSTGSWDKAAWMYSGNGSAPLGSVVPGGDPRYLDKVHAAITQSNTFNITGGNAADIAKATGKQLEASNGNLLRDFKTVTQ